MIEQIKHYRLTCDGLVREDNRPPRPCKATCEVDGTEKMEAIAHMPTWWTVTYSELSRQRIILCPREHWSSNMR